MIARRLIGYRPQTFRPLSIGALGLICCLLFGLALHPSQVSAREVRAEETCEIPVTIIANVPESIQKGKSFRVSGFIIKPSNTYGVTISSSLTELTATNTNSTSFNQDFLRTDPSPTTGSDFYTAFYPDWVIDASGDVGNEIEIKLKGSTSQVSDLGEINCTYSSTLATVPIVAEETDDLSKQPSSNPSVVAFRVAFLDSYGRPIKDARIKIGSIEKTTNDDGQASFTNILSGNKLITAVIGEERVQGEYVIGNDFTLGPPAVTLRKPAPPFYQNPFFIGIVGFTSILTIIIVSVVIIKRRKQNKQDEVTASYQNLQGIIQGSINSDLTEPIIIPEPNQPPSVNPTIPIAPAPWQLPVDKIPMPIQPLQTINSPPSQPSTIQASTNTTPNQEQTSTSGGIQIPVTQLQSSPSPLPTTAIPPLPGTQVPQNDSPSPTSVNSNPEQGQPTIQQPPSTQ
jgi:hypothetical protein